LSNIFKYIIYSDLEGYTVRSKLAVLDHNNKIKAEEEGIRTVKNVVWQNSKANPGEKIKKLRKTKAPVTWQHEMVKDCLEIIAAANNDEDDTTLTGNEEVVEDFSLEEEYDESEDEVDDEMEHSVGVAFEEESSEEESDEEEPSENEG
jgi:hypothetical protein